MKKMKHKNDPSELTQLSRTWLIAVRQIKAWSHELGEKPRRVHLMAIFDQETHQPLRTQLTDQAPEATEIFELLSRNMQAPLRRSKQGPYRPQKIIYISDAPLPAELGNSLKTLNIEISQQPSPEWLTPLLEDLATRSEKKLNSATVPIMPLLKIDGMSEERARKFFAAAAEFYRQAPWEVLADDQPLLLTCTPPGEEWYVMLLGNAGLEYGLLFFANWEEVEQTYRFASDPLQHLPPNGWLSLGFEKEDMLPFEDLDAIQKYNWEIANPEAYPFPAIYRRETITRPTLEQLTLFEAALRAIPAFIKKYEGHFEEETERKLEDTLTCEVGGQMIQVRLSYPAGVLPAILPAEELFWFNEDEESEEDLAEPDDEDGDEYDLYPDQLDQLDPESLKRLRQAEKLVLKAWDHPSPETRIELAHQALAISSECADAYVILAEEESQTVEEAYDRFAKALQAAERVLGQKYFKKYAGEFWSIHATRPYMRARQGLADCLVEMGRYETAIDHYREMLRLNPDDHQGIRYQLMNLLLRLKRDAEAWELLEEYENDDFVGWDYSKALLLFRRQGASAEAERALKKALRNNRYVLPYLTGERQLPEEMPESFSYGTPTEAMLYASQHFANWWQTPGAIDWLKSRSTSSSETRKINK